MKKSFHSIIWIAFILLIIALTAIDLFIKGSPADSKIFWMLRLPRIVIAIIAGGALALSGAQMQSILRNPLADPHILGISAGASLGAAIATMSGWSSGISLVAFAFIGALISSLIILEASRRFAGTTTLLIFGVMLGFIVNAIVTILQFSTDAESMRAFYGWSAGSFSIVDWQDIIIAGIALLLSFILAISSRKGLDIILFGDEFASMAGADITKIRTTSMLSCCIATGVVTAFCGPIGFVGIVAPHIARSIFNSSSHKIILPASLLVGSIIALGADLLSQIPSSPLPISSTMAVIGIPIIIYILVRKPQY